MNRYLPLCLIAGLVVAFRLLGAALPANQPNFQPLAALFFCGALLAPGWRGLAIPLVIWAITYPFASGPVENPAIFATTLAAFAATFGLGKLLARRGFIALMAGSLAAAVLFHLITNTAAWVGDPMYAKTWDGLWQSLWTGPAGSPLPSWLFLRNFAAANLLFTLMFVGAQCRIPGIATGAHLRSPLPAK